MILSLVVALTTAAPAAPAPLPIPRPLALAEAVKGSLYGVGTEPFWSIDISPDYIVLTVPDEESGDKSTEYRVEYTTSAGDNRIIASGPLTLTLSPAACSDGMSEVAYPYTIEVVLAGKDMVTLKGCAYRPWGQDILAAMPVIDACLAIAKDDPAIVYAAATAKDAGFVVMPGNEDKPMDACTVTAGKAAIAPLTDESVLPPGVNAEIFIRGPGKNPGGECYDAPEVKDADGKLLGWWLDPLGC